MNDFHTNYETTTVDLSVHGKPLRLFVPKDLDRFIDPEDPMKNFPLWAKIWESSLVLAETVAAMPPDAGKTILEIGGGIGMVSIVAARFGHHITMTENDPHALAFARANADANSCPDLPIHRLSWNAPGLTGQFSTIIGSEIIYREEDFDPLLRLFRTYLAPGGEIILTAALRKNSLGFLGRLRQAYDVRTKKFTLRSEDGETAVVLSHIKEK